MKDAVYNFINMVDDEIMKKHFIQKYLITTKKDDEDSKSSTKCW